MRKPALLLLIFFSFSFAAIYSAPPLHIAMEANEDKESELGDQYNGTLARKGLATIVFPDGLGHVELLDVGVSMDIASPTLMVGNSTAAIDGLKLLIAHGYYAEPMMALRDFPAEPVSPYPCDSAYFDFFQQGSEPGWRCDFDNDNCVEYIKDTWMEYDAEVIFTFHNVTAAVPLDSNSIAFPDEILIEMRNASGAENLTVHVNGTAKVIFEINDREPSACTSDEYTYNTSFIISEIKEFRVEGTQKAFFLRAPILREQWYRNNRFDMIVLSQSRIYESDILLNGTSNCTLHTNDFEIVDDRYGLKSIVLLPTNDTEFVEYHEVNFSAAPILLHNQTFGYFYQYHCNYEGIGKNNLTIRVTDVFGGEASHSEMIVSRMMSHDGDRDELGGTADHDITRPSAEFTPDSIQFLRISAGMLGLLLILLLVNRRFIG